MRVSVRLSKLVSLAAAVVAGSLCWCNPAWAGGSADAGSVQTFLDSICSTFSVAPCPKLPTVTQGVLAIAGYTYSRPESIRASQNISPGSVYASNLPPIPGNPLVPVVLPVKPKDFANLALTPLAFISASSNEDEQQDQQQATPTQLYNPAADTFLSAVTSFGSVQGTLQPQMLNVFYEDLSQTNREFTSGQVVADLWLPLAVAKLDASGNIASETPVFTKLEIKSCANGQSSCFKANAIGGIGTPAKPIPADQLGLHFAIVFGPSLVSTETHLIVEVQVPLLISNLLEPVYFSFTSPQASIIGTVTFGVDDVGAPAPGLGPGSYVGIPPYPGPQTPVPTPSPNIVNFGVCASLPPNDNGQTPVRAVAAFLDIATDGTTLVSAPTGSSTNPAVQCP